MNNFVNLTAIELSYSKKEIELQKKLNLYFNLLRKSKKKEKEFLPIICVNFYLKILPILI